MKRIATLLIALFAATVLVLAGCGGKTEDNNPPAPSETVEVTTTVSSLEIGKYDVAGKNYTSYFAIKDNGVSVPVRREYVDSDGVKAEPGTYSVICKYKDKQATLTVTVRQPEIELSAKQTSVSIKKRQAAGYDFTTLFTLTEDGHEIRLPDGAVQSTVKALPGEYQVTATVSGKTATVKVIVEQPECEIKVQPSEIEISDEEVAAYDFTKHFTLTEDGDKVAVTREMLQGEVLAAPGEYTLTLTAGNATGSLTVKVVHLEKAEAYVCYKVYELTEAEAKTFDCTRLFMLFVRGKAEKVTPEMVDGSRLANAVAGNEYEIKFSYVFEGEKIEKTAIVRVVAPPEVRIISKNVETYPNSGVLDLKSLFTIYEGDKEIPVTADMIEGSVNYSEVGENEITLTYGGKTAKAVVYVRMGVVINAPGTIKIRKGTNKESYDFAGDFGVKINGMDFSLIPRSYFAGLDEVDFGKTGKYEVTLSVPYCTTVPDVWSGTVDFDTTKFTLTYEVVDSFYTVEVIKPEITLAKGTTSFDAFSNLKVTINDKKQTLTTNKDWVDGITCYAELVSGEIDFTSAGEQRVRIAVYAEGPENEPVYAEYTLTVDSGVKINAFDTVVFTGATLKAGDLFEIIKDGAAVAVTFDMIEGKADVFAPGRYVLTLTYEKVTARVTVTVIDANITGTYFTGIMYAVEEDNEDYGDGSEDWGTDTGTSSVAPTKSFGDMIVRENGEMVINGRAARMADAETEREIKVYVGDNDYSMYYENGIAVLVPVNSLRMPYSNERRSLAYFSSDRYELVDRLIVNSSSNHVIMTTYASYTIELFDLKDKQSGESFTFALYTRLVEKRTTDSYYEVKWGKAEVTLSGSAVGSAGSLTFDGQRYNFTITDKKFAKIDKTDAVKEYAGMTFRGTVDGKDAVLAADNHEGFEYLVDGKTVKVLSSYEMSAEKGGGSDYANKTVFMFGIGSASESPFSYKFKVDPENKTFALLQRDEYFGKYVSDNMYIFLDGYGTGFISFDSKSYSKTRIRYEVKAGELIVTYFDVLPSFAYGESASFVFDTFGNVLTVRNIEGMNAEGIIFENAFITDGAIVRVKNDVMGAEASLAAEARFFAGIEIITADGTLSEAEKRKCTDISTISFTTPGFYRYTVTVNLRGKPTTATYALQILEKRYDGNDMAVSLGKGAVTGYFVTLDAYGRITVDCGGMVFTGLADIEGEKISAVAKSSDGGKILVKAERVKDGLFMVGCIGTVVFDDYFTAGEITAIGGKNFVLRAVTAAGEKTYFLSETSTLIGSEVTVSLLEGGAITDDGAIVEVTGAGTSRIVRLDKWGNLTNGITFAGSERGSYTSADGALILDGFGKATLDGNAGAYVLSGDKLAFTDAKSGNITAFTLNTTQKTAEKMQFAADETLVKGKTYTATYNFYYEDEAYSATTSFAFTDDGKVIISSASSDFEEGDYASKYAPVFVGEGTYSVKNGVVTVSVGKNAFTFNITNVLAPGSMTLAATTLTSENVGYFAAGTVFNA